MNYSEASSVDCGSWRYIEQNHIRRSSGLIQRGKLWRPEGSDVCCCVLIFSFVIISIDILETYRIDNWEFLHYFTSIHFFKKNF